MQVKCDRDLLNIEKSSRQGLRAANAGQSASSLAGMPVICYASELQYMGVHSWNSPALLSFFLSAYATLRCCAGLRYASAGNAAACSPQHSPQLLRMASTWSDLRAHTHTTQEAYCTAIYDKQPAVRAPPTRRDNRLAPSLSGSSGPQLPPSVPQVSAW